jgi:lysozyme
VRLESDIHIAGDAVRRCVRVPLTDGQAVALRSLAFNIGGTALCRSTLARLANAGEPAFVWCRQLLRFVYAGGRKWRGLEIRRQKEYELCLS